VSIADLATTCFAVQLLVGAILLIGEASGRLRLPYGKFRTGAGVNSRAGLALAYATPVFVYIALWVEDGSPRTLYHLAVFGALLCHFVRRIFEVSFVNSYSRPTPLRALVIIAFLYGGAAASCAFFQVRTFGQPTSPLIFILGILIFAFGEVLNGYHHWLLARLRPLGVRIYVVPRHGLFGWVACPQLLGRNFEFCGIRNNVWPAAGVGQHAGRFGISERKSQLDSQLVSAGEAADNSLTLASAHTVRLLAAPLLRSLRSFVRQRGRCLSNRREGPRRPMHQ
jgi:hypothetical protein